MSREHDPGGPLKGFIGTETSSVYSVFSNLSESNKVSNNDEHKVNEPVRGRTDAPSSSSPILGVSFTASSIINTDASNLTDITGHTNHLSRHRSPERQRSPKTRSEHNMAGRSLSVPASQCLFCDQSIIDKSKCIRCSVCLKPIHFRCAESGTMDENVLKLTKIKQIYYVCVKCSPVKVKGRLLIEDKDGNIISQEAKEFRDKLKFNEQYTLKQSNEIDRLLTKN